MRNVILAVCLFVSIPFFSQTFEYRKDKRSQHKKDDPYNEYSLNQISKYDLLQALEMTGVYVRKFPLKEFDKEYSLKVVVAEFEDGKKIDAKVINVSNSYLHTTDSI